MTISAPLRAGTPNGPAAPPDKKDGTAILMVSFAWAVPPARARAETAASPNTRVTFFVNIMILPLIENLFLEKYVTRITPPIKREGADYRQEIPEILVRRRIFNTFFDR